MFFSHFPEIYRPFTGLMTDLYQLTMAYGYWKTGIYSKKASFQLFYRHAPFGGAGTVTAGLAMAVDYLENLRFSDQDVHYLGNLRDVNGKNLFDEGFLNYLQRFRFSCDVWAMPEGVVSFPFEPLMRIDGPLIEAQLIETALLNLINYSTLVATKAARVVQAAQGDTVLEFGLRRAQGPDGGLTAARSAYIGGCDATSNLLAGKIYGIPVKGTHAHSWVMCFEDELSAFEAYSSVMPGNCILLVDTYDTLKGVENAVIVGRQLRQRGYNLSGIRLDSGDLAVLSVQARKILDEAGFNDTLILASNDLDEDAITRLKQQGAKVDAWGVGTKLVTAFGQPALGGVYKLSALEKSPGNWEYKIKLSETPEKTTNPGLLQVRRFFDHQGQPAGDLIFDADESSPGAETLQSGSVSRFEDLLIPVFREGNLVYQPPALPLVRANCSAQRGLFDGWEGREYPVVLSDHMKQRKLALIERNDVPQSESGHAPRSI